MLASEPYVLHRGCVTADSTFLSLKGGLPGAGRSLFASIDIASPVRGLLVES